MTMLNMQMPRFRRAPKRAVAPGLRSRDGANPETGLDMGEVAHARNLAEKPRLVKRGETARLPASTAPYQPPHINRPISTANVATVESVSEAGENLIADRTGMAGGIIDALRGTEQFDEIAFLERARRQGGDVEND